MSINKYLLAVLFFIAGFLFGRDISAKAQEKNEAVFLRDKGVQTISSNIAKLSEALPKQDVEKERIRIDKKRIQYLKEIYDIELIVNDLKSDEI